MTIPHAIVLGLVQGFTEFLPVSSSGHLILVPKLLGWPDQGLGFDAMIHFGTALAAIYHFRTDCHHLVRSVFTRTPDDNTRRLRNAILVGSIPAIVAALLLHDWVDSHARNVTLIAVNLILWAIIMLAADRYAKRLVSKSGSTASSATTASVSTPTVPSAAMIGAAQAIALLPGTSRSGSTIATSIFTGLDRSSAVRFSFLLGLPIILLASLSASVELFSAAEAGQIAMAPLLWGLITSFVGGILAIRVLLRFVESNALTYFAAYRIALAIFILLYLR